MIKDVEKIKCLLVQNVNVLKIWKKQVENVMLLVNVQLVSTKDLMVNVMIKMDVEKIKCMLQLLLQVLLLLKENVNVLQIIKKMNLEYVCLLLMNVQLALTWLMVNVLI